LENYFQFEVQGCDVNSTVLAGHLLDWFPMHSTWMLLKCSDYSAFDVYDATLINQMVGFDLVRCGRATDAVQADFTADARGNLEEIIKFAWLVGKVLEANQHAQIVCSQAHGSTLAVEDGFVQFFSVDGSSLDRAKKIANEAAEARRSRPSWYLTSTVADW